MNPATNTDPRIYSLADKLIGLPHEVGIFGVPVHDMGMTQRIMQMSAAVAASDSAIRELSAALVWLYEVYQQECQMPLDVYEDSAVHMPIIEAAKRAAEQQS